jgi:hypothetical protein
LAGLDFKLQYRPPAEIDLARFGVWARRLAVDAGGDEPGEVAGDVTTLELIWDRIAHAVDADAARAVESRLVELRSAADGDDLEAAAEAAPALLEAIDGVRTSAR